MTKADMEHLIPFFAPILTAFISAGGVYAATMSRLTRLETMIEALRRDVEKHNRVVERTFVLERDVKNINHRLSEMHDDVRNIKIGGTE